MKQNNRNELLYQKNQFNSSLICMLPNIIKCCKCKKNNIIKLEDKNIFQYCVFCGNPNYVKK